MSPIEITLFLLLFATVMFVWERIPLALTAIIVCLALVLTGVLDAKSAFNGFINTNVILFVGMFIVGGALFETGMANRIGGLVTRFAKTERQLIVAIMVIVGMLSGVLSNTGTAAILIPVVIGIAAKSGFSRSRLLMPLVFAAAMGGNLSLIGAPGNLIAQSALQKVGLEFSFFEYAKVGLPLLAGGIIYFAFFGYRLLPAGSSKAIAGETEVSHDFSSVPKWKQITSLVVMIAAILGMVFESAIGVPLHITACVGAAFLVLVGVLTEKQAYRAIDTQTIFIFGGTLALASALEQTGAGAAVASTIMNLLGTEPSPVLLLVVIFFISCALTNFMSNTATTALLVPIGMSIAANLGADPRAVLMAIVIGGSCAYATPIGMPANLMVLSAGGYKFADYVKCGLPLIFVAGAIAIPLLLLFFPFFPS
ncbi:SLC13 family permease [Stutzerimonas degradans]|uniref:Cation transporter n=1 Tax=Stutzerimonas degradans TaxID=2968968 RepID=A0A8E2QAY0_9GAMM|nr:SLC13 family permease [Stutzerimonas degradans]MCQ4277054.1 SLC13 family permease [Stutzerimonas degradans]PNF75082.1 cation transporter [Stutzerimonas degradans]QPT21562.1 SLC13/DASS family transporter [Stutzerimonas degradans]